MYEHIRPYAYDALVRRLPSLVRDDVDDDHGVIESALSLIDALARRQIKYVAKPDPVTIVNDVIHLLEKLDGVAIEDDRRRFNALLQDDTETVLPPHLIAELPAEPESTTLAAAWLGCITKEQSVGGALHKVACIVLVGDTLERVERVLGAQATCFTTKYNTTNVDSSHVASQALLPLFARMQSEPRPCQLTLSILITALPDDHAIVGYAYTLQRYSEPVSSTSAIVGGESPPLIAAEAKDGVIEIPV